MFDPMRHTSLTDDDDVLITPYDLRAQYPLNLPLAQQILTHRQTISQIIKHNDPRLLVILGPCSIAQVDAALVYAEKLKQASLRFKDTMFLVMRAYIAKPRTTLGWKGLMYDPKLSGQSDINLGLSCSRELLIKINQLGIPTALEWLDPLIVPYLEDCVSWGCLGARTVESQIHREMVSNLTMPIGFKNNTSGNTQVAIDAMQVASQAQDILRLDDLRHIVQHRSQGNPDTHLVLRGSQQQSNFDSATVQTVSIQLHHANLSSRIMIDCSHGNSAKDYQRQAEVVNEVCLQLAKHRNAYLGLMIESHLKAGQQRLTDPTQLTFGVSITDPCLGWEQTLLLLEKLHSTMLSPTHTGS